MLNVNPGKSIANIKVGGTISLKTTNKKLAKITLKIAIK